VLARREQFRGAESLSLDGRDGDESTVGKHHRVDRHRARCRAGRLRDAGATHDDTLDRVACDRPLFDGEREALADGDAGEVERREELAVLDGSLLRDPERAFGDVLGDDLQSRAVGQRRGAADRLVRRLLDPHRRVGGGERSLAVGVESNLDRDRRPSGRVHHRERERVLAGRSPLEVGGQRLLRPTVREDHLGAAVAVGVVHDRLVEHRLELTPRQSLRRDGGPVRRAVGLDGQRERRRAPAVEDGGVVRLDGEKLLLDLEDDRRVLVVDEPELAGAEALGPEQDPAVVLGDDLADELPVGRPQSHAVVRFEGVGKQHLSEKVGVAVLDDVVTRLCRVVRGDAAGRGSAADRASDDGRDADGDDQGTREAGEITAVGQPIAHRPPLRPRVYHGFRSRLSSGVSVLCPSGATAV